MEIPNLLRNKVENKVCDHHWKLVAKTYGAPRRDINNTNEAVIEKVLFGVTSFLWECMDCFQTKKEEMLGSEGNRLDDILDQVDSTNSPYMLQRNGMTFLIGKYTQPNQNNVVLR